MFKHGAKSGVRVILWFPTWGGTKRRQELTVVSQQWRRQTCSDGNNILQLAINQQATLPK